MANFISKQFSQGGGDTQPIEQPGELRWIEDEQGYGGWYRIDPETGGTSLVTGKDEWGQDIPIEYQTAEQKAVNTMTPEQQDAIKNNPDVNARTVDLSQYLVKPPPPVVEPPPPPVVEPPPPPPVVEPPPPPPVVEPPPPPPDTRTEWQIKSDEYDKKINELQKQIDEGLKVLPIDPTIKVEGGIEKAEGQQTGLEQQKALESFLNDLETKANTEKLSRQTQFSDLINKQKLAGEGYLSEFRSGRKQRMADLANLLSQSNERNMSEYTPSMLEDLSGRGLLHSSAVGENLATRRKQLAGSTAEALQAQNLADLEAEQGLSGSILKNTQDLEKAGLQGNVDLSQWGLDTSKGLGTTGYQNQFDLAKALLGNQATLRQAGLERNFSLQDQSAADALAKELGGQTAKADTTNAYTGILGKLGGIALDKYLTKLWG